jgi:hypothetical protein
MECEDARECFLLFREGKIRLTELAAVEAHISQCATCREELDRLQEEKPLARASRGPSADASQPATLTDGPRRRLLLVFTVLASVAAVVTLIALASHVYQQRQEHRIALEEATAARDRYEPRQPATPESPVSSSSPAPPKAVPPVAQTLRPEVAGRSADLGPKRAVPLPSPPPPADRGARQKPTASEASPGAASRGQRAAAPPAASAPSTDVVVQLSVTDRSAAERDLSTLLARVGATQVRRQRDFTFVAVVPQSRYGEFTRGMTQIGSWQMETGRSTVPDPVHVAVRLVSPGSRRSGPGT